MRATIEKAAHGDANALYQVFMHYRPTIIKAVGKLRHRTLDMEDLLHDIYVKLANNFHKCNNYDPRVVGGYIRTIARNLLIDKMRKIKRCILVELSIDIPDNRHSNSDLIEAISTLNVIYRDCIYMHYFEKMNMEEIANKLDIPVGTVKRRLHVARNKLAEVLENV